MRCFSKLACPHNFFREGTSAHLRKPRRTCICRPPTCRRFLRIPASFGRFYSNFPQKSMKKAELTAF